MTTFALRSLRTFSIIHCGLPKQHSAVSTTILKSSSSRICPASTSTITPKSASTNHFPSPSEINGPRSTLPAPLDLPTRQPNQSFFPTYAFKLGKAYATFYKTGVFNIYKNFQSSQPLQRTLASKYNSSLSAFIASGQLTRSGFQLLKRNWHDIKRVPAFALVFLICGEFTPLVVITMSNIVPWTCRIPKQITSDRKKLEERRRSSFRNLTIPPPKEAGVEGLNREQLMHISWSLGLSSRVWDWADVLLTDGLLRKKVRERLEYLRMDDTLIMEGGGIREMEVDETQMACVERGIDVLGRTEAEVRKELGLWLRTREHVPAETLLLTRPSVWSTQPAKAKNNE